jgi:PEGA domain
MKTLNRWLIVGLGFGLAPSLLASNLFADDREIAANLFDAGAEAYDAGQYLIAAEAFLKAHELLKSPALHYSAAQAYRRQYLVDGSPDALRRAVRLYREYIREDGSGQRREEAVSALADLVPLEARLKRKTVATIAPTNPTPTPATTDKPISGKPAPIPIPVPTGNPTNPAPVPGFGAQGAEGDPKPQMFKPDIPLEESEELEPEPPRKTRLLISTKPALADVSIDGGGFVRVPAVVEVKAGPRKVHVKAEGYFDEDVQMDAVDKELVARHVVLRPKPGRLSVESVRGASLSLDGQLRAVLPLERPLEVEPGDHFITITQSGRISFSKTITIERDKDVKVSAPLALTNQRIGAWSTFTVGMLGAAATGILGGLTWNQNSIAANFDANRQAGSMTPNEIASYNNALRTRNTFSSATMIAGGASALVLLTSVGMFLFDNPPVIPVPQKKKDSGPQAPRVEMTVGLLSAGVRVDF